MANTNRPYSPSPEYRYFLYDPNDGHTFYRTPEERDIAAKSLIEDYLDDGEWSEQVVDIYAGEATHQVAETERIDKVGKLDDDGYDENGEYWGFDDVDYKCGYSLRPLMPTPPANHSPDATEMVAPPAEGEAWEQVVWLRSLIGESVWFEPGSENASKLAHAAYVLLNQSDQIAELQRQLNRRTRPNG